jgi:agmatine deiminase
MAAAHLHNSTSDSRLLNGVPRDLGFRRTAETDLRERTFMAWPHRADLYGSRLLTMQAGYAAVARAIAGFEQVTMIAHPDHAAEARRLLGNHAEVIELQIDDAWVRDSGPTFVRRSAGQLAGISWNFNAWGRKHAPWNADNALAERLLARYGIPVCRSWLTCEGGSLCSDGDGTLIVTETSILNPNRNPGVSKGLATAELKAMLGIEKIIWLPGDPMDLETDGHIDGMCAYVRPGVVLFETNSDPTDPHARILAENLSALRMEIDAKGRTLEVIPLEEAVEAEVTSEIFCRSYINFALVNGGVIMPAYGTIGDAKARATLACAFPDRKIVKVDVRAIAPAGGAIHCITQEMPAVGA